MYYGIFFFNIYMFNNLADYFSFESLPSKVVYNSSRSIKNYRKSQSCWRRWEDGGRQSAVATARLLQQQSWVETLLARVPFPVPPQSLLCSPLITLPHKLMALLDSCIYLPIFQWLYSNSLYDFNNFISTRFVYCLGEVWFTGARLGLTSTLEWDFMMNSWVQNISISKINFYQIRLFVNFKT